MSPIRVLKNVMRTFVYLLYNVKKYFVTFEQLSFYMVATGQEMVRDVCGMAVRGALSPLSGIICEIVNSLGQGHFTSFRKRSGNF